ncbi:NACHT domain-containing protein [Actinocrispum sp. NPDC049592]|uniref:NACHT domain-containing protein n=1 Tax=Actinocrispum sp. NPDC049592 TaxID=3154835 RepID=UPI0034305F96
MHQRPAVHRTILVVDVEGFGDQRRTNPNQLSVRDGLYRSLRIAFDKADIAWSECRTEDRGDGVLILAPAAMPKAPFAELLPGALVAALREHNAEHPEVERIRLRVAMHAGEINYDDHGVTGASINHAFRLCDAPQLKTALAESQGIVAVISSSWFFDEVIRHSAACDLASYRSVNVAVKETNAVAWICRPDDPFPPRATTFGGEPESDFERRYLNFVMAETSTFELFQVTRGGMPVGSSFDEFYVTPPIMRRGATSELTGAGTDAGNAIAEARRVLLLGGAGAGKTTFLTWLAYLAADTRDQEGPWRGVVPFFVSLRHFTGAMPQQPGKLLAAVAPMLTGDKLDEWATGLFVAGRAMLLVDGLDELVAERRHEVKRWLEKFVRAYPEARYVVSTRPSAVDDGWFVDEPRRVGLIRFELLPLSTSGLRRVIERWYAAALKQEADPAQREWLKECRTSLWENLSARPNLRTLVASPLLAALLCALYRQNNQYLPRTRRELLDQALDLLLGRWDDAKPSFTPADRMTKAEQLILLERFAAPMVRGAELMVSHSDAQRRLERAMIGLRSQGLEADRLLEHMLVRTGLLREYPADQKIEFIHRTFRDYLAAADMVKAGELEALVDNAHKDSWFEVVFMAAAQAREREVADLLKRLLRHAVQHKEKDVADRLVLVAAACLGYADVVYPDQVRVDVQNAAKRLIPPADFHDAEMLAKAGSFVVDLLPGPDEAGPELAPFVIRTLAMIGGEEAWEKIRPFTALHQSTVVDELLRGWREFDFADDYARILLSQVDFQDRALEVRRWGLLPRLRHLTTLQSLKLIGNVSLADSRAGLYPLADIPQLSTLDIVANETIRHLRPLVRCRSLRTLRISGYSMLTDLSALASCSVDDLTLLAVRRTANQPPIDLSSLTGARLTALTIQHRALADGLHVLPDLPLVELTVKNRADQRSLAGIERWKTLEMVTCTGVPREPEVEALAELPALRHLVIHAPTPAKDLARIRPLTWSLDVLDLHDVDDPTAALDAIGPDTDVDIRFFP